MPCCLLDATATAAAVAGGHTLALFVEGIPPLQVLLLVCCKFSLDARILGVSCRFPNRKKSSSRR